MAFFKPGDEPKEESKMLENSANMETSMLMIDKPIDYEKDVEIDLERAYTRYVRFNARH